MGEEMWGLKKGQVVRVIAPITNFKNKFGKVSEFREDTKAVGVDFKKPGFQKIWFVPSELEPV